MWKNIFYELVLLAKRFIMSVLRIILTYIKPISNDQRPVANILSNQEKIDRETIKWKCEKWWQGFSSFVGKGVGVLEQTFEVWRPAKHYRNGLGLQSLPTVVALKSLLFNAGEAWLPPYMLVHNGLNPRVPNGTRQSWS